MKYQRLAIVTTHPIQYNAPLFKLLNEENKGFIIKVFYTWSQARDKVLDKEFNVFREWDIPLLEGYNFTFVKNTSTHPGSHHFKGIVNPTLNDKIEDWKADAVLVYGWAFSSHLKALRYFNKKILVLFRGDSTLIDEPSSASAKKLLRRFFLRWVYTHVDYALYVGSANRSYFLAHGLNQQQLLFAPHAIDNARFSKELSLYSERAKEWRKALGIPMESRVFLFAGKLTRKKDPELLIKAFLSLAEPETRLLLVGNGELENELKGKYANNATIVFFDFQNQSLMPVVYRLGDVFVLPSKGPGETWGLAVNEAMACGRSVIASDKCGCSADLIIDGRNGYVFQSENEQDLLRCMRLSLLDYKMQGNESLVMIKQWNYQRTIEQLEMILEQRRAR